MFSSWKDILLPVSLDYFLGPVAGQARTPDISLELGQTLGAWGGSKFDFDFLLDSCLAAADK